MPIVEQSVFSLGQVDEIYFKSTAQQQYLEALSVCHNAHVTSQRMPVRRGAAEMVIPSPAYPNYDTNLTMDTTTFQSSAGAWYQIQLRLSSGKTDIYLTKFGNRLVNEVLTPLEQVKVIQVKDYEYDSEEPSDLDVTATDEYIVISTPRLPPQKLVIDETTLAKSKMEIIEFSVVPSLDFGDVDYSKYTFEPAIDKGVFGGRIDVERPKDSDPEFTDSWVGGLIVGRTGASVQQPIGFGLITKIEKVNDTTQRFTVTVLQAFGDKNYSKEGPTWSVRKPVWGPSVGYPAKTTFYKGRLWFANTRQYPMLICGSRENTPNDFNVNNGEPPDAICYILQNSEGGGIKNIFGGVNLHIFTNNQQLAVTGGLDIGITPANFSPKLVSSFTTSNVKPVKYRNSVYFTTAQGKSLVQILEQDQAVSSEIISFTSQSLIKNPVKFVTFTIKGTQEQLLVALNEDKTMTVYSHSDITGVSAFSSYSISQFDDEFIASIDVIDNVLYFVNSKQRLMYVSNRKDFDLSLKVKIKNGIVTLPSELKIPDKAKFGVMYTLTDSQGNEVDNYLGEFTSYVEGFRVKIDTRNPELTEDGRVGLLYSTKIKTLPLFSGPRGSFKKKKVSQAWVNFFNSFNFQINGRDHGTNLPINITSSESSARSLTGTARIGFARGAQQDYFIEIDQKQPYDLQLQSIAWSVSESVIN